MERIAFKMKLKSGNEKEYKKRHDEIWPELSKAIKDAGIKEYSIFLDEETLTLFAFHKLEKNNSLQKLAQLACMKTWWDFMADIMEVNPDNSPVVHDLKEVFFQA
ncbi:MAG: L-rhamnose mutarotase [Reichenbachiella sp.]